MKELPGDWKSAPECMNLAPDLDFCCVTMPMFASFSDEVDAAASST
uniref:Uncharacterized protein n=1 Tax=Medicago truncatula TaxID=3880 RepID=Q2HSW9_MEDTR|nr:hypothetical protein MtrDRAFT_AC150891g7v2 [Medicago truncatula]